MLVGDTDGGHTVTFVNEGSVGRPRDGDWRACLAVVDPGVTRAGELGVALVRVPYDHERLTHALAGTSLITRFQGPDDEGGVD